MPLETSPSLTEIVEPDRAASPPSAGVRAERIVKLVSWHIVHTVARTLVVVRFGLFVLYQVVGLLTLWVWIGLALISLLYLTLRGITYGLLWLAGGVAPRPGPPPPRTISERFQRDLEALWADRLV